AIIAMAHNLNLRVIAEGVEAVTQFEFLNTLQCDLHQGFLFSRPVPAEEFEKLLEKRVLL
ncbi:MAG TPA: EAL domain-containing protein, partial [Spirochaetota bacterium]|nr:EAL domain-containing protein [Spirochaetota bacterium]